MAQQAWKASADSEGGLRPQGTGLSLCRWVSAHSEGWTLRPHFELQEVESLWGTGLAGLEPRCLALSLTAPTKVVQRVPLEHGEGPYWGVCPCREGD